MLRAEGLASFCDEDPRVLLVPGELLSPGGVSVELRRWLAERVAWEPSRIDFLDRAFSLYWIRASTLASRSPDWPPPRRRNLALVHRAYDVLPYTQILNTSCWTLYDVDFDPHLGDPEFAAYLLIHGDRMASTGEVTQAAVRNAAYWFDRNAAEIAAFRRAAAASTRPDAAAFCALGDAIDGLRQCADAYLRPPAIVAAHRTIPASSLLVPPAQEEVPPRLVHTWTEIAHAVVNEHRRHAQQPDPRALAVLCAWLADSSPPVVITARGKLAWDPREPKRLGALRAELRPACGAAIRSIQADLCVAAAKTAEFRAALRQPDTLPRPDPQLAQTGYVYLHRELALLAYDLHEPGIDRLALPALPYARAMLGARALHEWSHLAEEAGWIRRTITGDAWTARLDRCRQAFAAAIDQAPSTLRRLPDASPSELVDGIVTRLGDFRANLVLAALATPSEREAYVRQNVRRLRGTGGPWTRLARYLYEAQYLRFSMCADQRDTFFAATGFDTEFLANGVLSQASFDELWAAVDGLCDPWEPDPACLQLP